jgi:hypothetical protein
MLAKESFSIPQLTTLTGALKNLAPKVKELNSGKSEGASQLPCVKTASTLFNKYSRKIESIINLVGSLGLVPENLVDGIKKATASFSKSKVKDEF